MLCKYLLLLVQSCILQFVSSSVMKRYQDFPLQICPLNAVCSEIYEVPSSRIVSSYYSHTSCKCPTTSYCPQKPGDQTINADTGKWYGLCQPVSEIARCEPGQPAQQVVIEAPEFGGRSYMKIQCRCDGELMEDTRGPVWSGASTGSEAATYNLICNDDSMTKRGRGRFGGENSRSRGRFYFYKK